MGKPTTNGTPKPLQNMKLRHRTKSHATAPEQTLCETSFPLLDHAPGCTRARDKWFYTIDPDTGTVTLSCNQCAQTYTYELDAEEE